MGALIFLVIIICIIYVRKVPLNTAIIIDRDTHYLKTVRHGFYFLIPGRDKITTEVSTNKITKFYSNNFETHDGKIVSINFVASYHAENIDNVLSALQSARRSINDIVESSVYWAVNNLNLKDFISDKNFLISEISPKLDSEARELCIKIDGFSITNMYFLTNTSNIKPFKPHLSSGTTNGPIKFN